MRVLYVADPLRLEHVPCWSGFFLQEMMYEVENFP